MIRGRLTLLATLVAGLLGSGCFDSVALPTSKRPSFSPDAVAQQAMAQYDTNHDGKIDAQELKQCPALLDALDTADTNRDGALSEDEIRQRAQKWLDRGTQAIMRPVTVFLDGQPLEGATVTFTPEKCLGADYKPTSAVTDRRGNCSPPGDDPHYPGLHPGIYRVTISKIVGGRELLPARYNTATELGKEVAIDLPRAKKQFIFQLTSQ